MISCKGLYYGDKKTDKMLYMYEDEKPVGIQVFGEDSHIMSSAIKLLEEKENVIIDVNMGCPVPKIVKNKEGSALLNSPDKIYDIISSLTKATEKLVTAKIRIGFQKDDFLGLEAAKAIEAGGASAVTVHGRTREDFYSGTAKWDKIRMIREAVSIPVIANGDVTSGKLGKQIMNETGCDLVMIGRASLGNPWIFRELNQAYNDELITESPSLEERKSIMLEHLEMMQNIKGDYTAVREMRKFSGWYMKGLYGSSSFRAKVNTITDIEVLKNTILNL